MQQSSDHHGTYLSYAFASSDQYSALGQKAFNEGKEITDPIGNINAFQTGDVITDGTIVAFVASEEDGFNCYVINIYFLPVNN